MSQIGRYALYVYDIFWHINVVQHYFRRNTYQSYDTFYLPKFDWWYWMKTSAVKKNRGHTARTVIYSLGVLDIPSPTNCSLLVKFL